MTKVSFIVPARNKAALVAKTVDTVLAQTYSPLEIVLSDQGSTDGTLDILRAKANAYSGPNLVRVLQCPDQDFTGHAGLNRHLAWLWTQIEGDLVIMSSADDLNHPDRTLHTVAAWEEFYPSHIGTRMRFTEPNGKVVGETGFPERRSRFIEPVECIQHLIGSSTSPAWSRDLWEKYGPLGLVEASDMIIPIMALFERGFYYVDKPLFTYVRHASADNTGLEGVVRAMSEGSLEQIQTIETANYHMCSHWSNVARRLNHMGILHKLPHEFHAVLAQHIISNADKWAAVRDHMTIQRIEPKNMVA